MIIVGINSDNVERWILFHRFTKNGQKIWFNIFLQKLPAVLGSLDYMILMLIGWKVTLIVTKFVNNCFGYTYYTLRCFLINLEHVYIISMEFKKDDSGTIPESSFMPKLVFTPCPLFGVQFNLSSFFINQFY